MEHTAEPWMLKEHHSGAICLKDQFIAQCCEPTSAANARRIVACVNACAGLDQFALDGGWTAIGMSAYAKRLEQQRDELLAALEACVSLMAVCWDETNPETILARQAIANAKGA